MEEYFMNANGEYSRLNLETVTMECFIGGYIKR